MSQSFDRDREFWVEIVRGLMVIISALRKRYIEVPVIEKLNLNN